MEQLKNKISGYDRKRLKNKISTLKWVIKSFWYNHQLDKDMAKFYGSSETYPMKDSQAQIRYNQILEEIKRYENQLKEKI